MGKIIDNYIEEAPQLLSAIQNAVRTQDAVALSFVAHKLRSASVNLGATSITELCKELELIGRTGTTLGAQDKLSQLQAIYEPVIVALEKERQICL